MDHVLFSRVAANILQTEVRIVPDGAERAGMLADFEECHCFSRELQPTFTREGLEQLIDALPINCFCEAEGHLSAALMLFRFEDVVYLAGPYVREPYHERAVQANLALHRVSYSRIHAFRLYYSAMPLLVTETITKVLSGICQVFDPSCPCMRPGEFGILKPCLRRQGRENHWRMSRLKLSIGAIASKTFSLRLSAVVRAAKRFASLIVCLTAICRKTVRLSFIKILRHPFPSCAR